MKTKKYKYLLFAIAILATAISCNEDYLDVEPKGIFLSGNYYANQEQAFTGLVAAYDVMRKNSGGFENMVTMMNAGSDDFYAGGGNSSDGAGIQAFSNYTINPIEMPVSFWSDHYQGIYRANILLLRLPDVPMEENLKARYTAETKALRAYYYFNLVRMFGNIPLLLEPVSPSDMYNVTQADIKDVYGQIESDLLEAITVLPGTLDMTNEAGRFTKGAAQALLGKVYLYDLYNYSLSESKALAATELAKVNGTPGQPNQYGNKLLDDYNDLWIVDNKFNTESILEVAHTNVGLAGWGNWGSGSDEGNSINTMVGPRSYVQKTDNAPDLPSGWSFNPVLPELYNLLKADGRFGATILDLKALEESGDAEYIGGYQDTGYFLNKFTPTKAVEHTGAGDAILNYRQNSYAIRLADTYLLEAEALVTTNPERAKDLLNAVRSRADMPDVAVSDVSMDVIMAERRLELAGEGHRWFDLVRTGNAAAKLANRGFVDGKNNVFPIPFKELENTKLVQNPNY